MNKEVTVRTLETIEAEANAKVDSFNKEADLNKRITLESEIDGLVKEYNELSMLTAYATAKAEKLPIIALAKACTCVNLGKKKTPTIELVDGVAKRVEVISTQKKDSALNILKFIKWLEERNFKMPADWRTHMSAVKADVIDQWQAFEKSGDEHTFRIGQLKRLLQTMVNDMGFIAGEKGNNALVVKGAHAKTVLKYASKKTGVLSGETMTLKIWDDLLMTVLHSVATGGAFENTYGGSAVFKEETATEDAPAEEASAEAVAPAEATAEAVAEAK